MSCLGTEVVVSAVIFSRESLTAAMPLMDAVSPPSVSHCPERLGRQESAHLVASWSSKVPTRKSWPPDFPQVFLAGCQLSPQNLPAGCCNVSSCAVCLRIISPRTPSRLSRRSSGCPCVAVVVFLLSKLFSSKDTRQTLRKTIILYLYILQSKSAPGRDKPRHGSGYRQD